MSATSKDQLSSDIHPQVLSPTLDKTDDAAKTTELAVDDKIRRARDDFSRQSGMPLREGLGVYRSAVWWSALMTLTVVMEAYDYGLMGNLYGFPSFAQKFGQRLPSGMYNIRCVFRCLRRSELMNSAADQSILKQITKAGQLIGLFFTGWLVDRFGYKWTMLGSLLLLVPVVAYQYFAPNIGALIGAQFLLGVPLAPFLTLSNVSSSPHRRDGSDTAGLRCRSRTFVPSALSHLGNLACVDCWRIHLRWCPARSAEQRHHRLV